MSVCVAEVLENGIRMNWVGILEGRSMRVWGLALVGGLVSLTRIFEAVLVVRVGPIRAIRIG